MGQEYSIFTEDGYFITGDLGWLTNENNLVLVGRLKETIVLSLNKKTGRLFHEGKDKNVILSVNRNTGEVDSMDEDDKVILSLPKNRLVIELDQNTGQVKYKYPRDKKYFEDWKKQGLMYAWLLRKKGKFVDKLKFYGLLKDWTAREKRLADLKGDFYPETQVYEWCYEISENDRRTLQRIRRTWL